MTRKFVRVIPELHRRYIKGTAKDAVVQNARVFLCHLTGAVSIGALGLMQTERAPRRKVYISTRVLKHTYDKRPAEEYDFLTENLHAIVKYPDCVYKNKDSKRGGYCFVKTLGNKLYLCSLESVEDRFEVVTFFRVPKEKYLESYELLWSWRNGTSSS